MTKPKRKMGRPTKYNQRLGKAICMRMMRGESLRSICGRSLYPNKSTIFHWLHSNPDFYDQYRKAREIQQEHLYEEMFEIADDGSNDFVETEKGITYDREHVQRSKLRIDTRMWAMSRMAPKVFGDKKQVEHSGEVKHTDMSSDELDRKIAELKEKLDND